MLTKELPTAKQLVALVHTIELRAGSPASSRTFGLGTIDHALPFQRITNVLVVGAIVLYCPTARQLLVVGHTTDVSWLDTAPVGIGVLSADPLRAVPALRHRRLRMRVVAVADREADGGGRAPHRRDVAEGHAGRGRHHPPGRRRARGRDHTRTRSRPRARPTYAHAHSRNATSAPFRSRSGARSRRRGRPSTARLSAQKSRVAHVDAEARRRAWPRRPCPTVESRSS